MTVYLDHQPSVLVGQEGARDADLAAVRDADLARTALGSPAAALLAIDEETLFVALHDGSIVRSDSGGMTWEARATP